MKNVGNKISIHSTDINLKRKLYLKEIKVKFPPSKKVSFVCFNGRFLKMMTNAFYFMLNALFIL